MSIAGNENEYMGVITNNRKATYTEAFLAQENRIIDKVAEYRHRLQEVVMMPQHYRSMIDAHIRQIRQTCNRYREKFNNLMADDDFARTRHLLHNEQDHGCTQFFHLIEHLLEYYDPDPSQSEKAQLSEEPESEDLGLLSELIMYPEPESRL